MAMVGLAQFIHLGMDRVGSQALSQSSMDFFTLAISSWADLIEETIHRFATERLFLLNNFTDLTDFPRITHDSVGKVSLGELADYINKLSGQMLITPGPELEAYLREAADLPEKPLTVDEPKEKPSDETDSEHPEAKEAEDPKQMDGQPADAQPQDEPIEKASELFADKRGGKPGRSTKQIAGVNSYQAELGAIYDDWSTDTALEIAKADDDEKRKAAIAAALLLLLARLKSAGRKNLTEAMLLALGDEPPSPEILAALSAAIAANEAYLTDSLITAIQAKLEAGLLDPDILAALAQGKGSFAAALQSLLGTMQARVESYSGAWWTVYNKAIGDVAFAFIPPLRSDYYLTRHKNSPFINPDRIPIADRI